MRDAIRPFVAELLSRWGTSGHGLDLALAMLSVAFPVEASPVTARLLPWFDRAEPPLRDSLGLILAYHGAADEAVRQVVSATLDDEVRRRTRNPRRLAGPIYPRVRAGVDLAARLRSGADEATADFTAAFSFLMDLTDPVHHVIEWPR